MRFATEDDFIDVYDLFKKNRVLLPNIRMGHIARKIEERRCIFTDGVVIISRKGDGRVERRIPLIEKHPELVVLVKERLK